MASRKYVLSSLLIAGFLSLLLDTGFQAPAQFGDDPRSESPTPIGRRNEWQRAVKTDTFLLMSIDGKTHLPDVWHGRKIVRRSQSGSAYEFYPIGKYVVLAPGVCGGRPTFKGTRLEVRTILDCLRLGRSVDDVLKSYPSISKVAIQEAIRLATQALTEQYDLKAA